MFGKRDGAKYLQPTGSDVRLYIPSMVRSKLSDTNMELMITEGEKKTLKAVQEGFNCVGLGGVWNWVQNHKPIADLDLINWNKRQVDFVPDSDTWKKREVIQAVYAFCNELRYRGADVEIVKLPPHKDDKTGLDDYLKNYDRKQLDTLPRVGLNDNCFANVKAWYRQSDWHRIIIDNAIIDSRALAKANLPERETLLFPWLKEQSITLISAERGTGKTWFTFGIIQAIATGGTLGPWRAKKRARCAYVDAEMIIQDTDERLKKLPGDKPKSEQLIVYSSDLANLQGETEPNLADKVWREAIEQWLVRNHIKCWVIDNVSSIT